MKFFDRVKETATTTGTGAFTLAGAVTGFRTFASVLSTNDTCYYCIALQGGSEWEVGLGTYSAANTLTRTTVLSSSNAGSAVNFSVGTKDVFLTVAARSFVKPSFKARKDATSQTITGSTYTLVTFNTEVFDNDGCYDVANSRFVPQLAGYYHIGTILALNTAVEGYVYLRKNNAAYIYSRINSLAYKLDDLIYLNGSTDYVDVWIYLTSGRSVGGDDTSTSFYAYRVD
ncbi:MAG: hypothetical protein AB9919_06965 [Geobacteraceae bacterium]